MFTSLDSFKGLLLESGAGYETKSVKLFKGREPYLYRMTVKLPDFAVNKIEEIAEREEKYKASVARELILKALSAIAQKDKLGL